MRIIIFGGNGFVGQWLIKHFAANDIDVLCCDKDTEPLQKEIAYICVDIRTKDSLNMIPITDQDIVINLAANQYHGKVPRKNRSDYFFETNTAGAENILRASYEKGCRNVIQFTTDMVYGKPQYLPIDTSHPQKPFGFYGQSKVKLEKICKEYRDMGMNITIFRPRMIIGPGRLGILKKLFWLIRHNLPVPTIGSGKNCYQMVSVFDCVSAIQCAINAGIPSEEYNLGSKKPPSTRLLLQNLIKSVGSHSIVVPTPGKAVKCVLGGMEALGLELMYKEQYMIADKNYILDISKTEQELSWHPEYSDNDMIVQAYQEYIFNLH